MPTPLRIGLIGAGMHARQILVPAMTQIPDDLHLVVCATGREETARRAGEALRVPWVVGCEAVLACPEVDAVVIATFDHEAHALAALEAGKHVFIETPAIVTRDGAARIRQLARERGLVYQTGSCLRYAPIYQQFKRLLDAWRAEAPGPRVFNVRYYPYYGHLQNLLLFLNGPIAAVQVAPGEDGCGLSLYRFANGDLASITWCAFHNVTVPYEAVEAVHPSGRLLAEDGRALRIDRTPADRAVHPYHLEFALADAQVFSPTFSIPYGKNEHLYLRGYTPELADFARCVRDGDTPISNVDSAEATLLVREACARSTAAGGTWVDVEA